MRTSLLASLTLAITLAAPLAANAHEGAQPVHRHHYARHRAIDARAAAQVPGSISVAALPIFGIRPSTSVVPEEPDAWEGLGRNPDDCVKYGCIDNGGE